MMSGADENEPRSTPDVEPQLLEDDDRSRCVSPFQGAPAIILGGLVMAVGIYLLQGSNLFLSLPAGVAIYLVSLIVVRTFNSEERHLLRDIARQLVRA